MRIALIFPPTNLANSLDASLSGGEHLGLGYLASSLRINTRYEVQIINGEIEQYNESQLIKALESFDADVIGFSPVSESMEITLNIARFFKLNHKTINIMGGHLASLSGEEILKKEWFIDYIIRGDGEYPLLRLLKNIEFGKNEYGKISGLVWRNGSTIKKNKIVYHEFDKVPNPARDDLERMISYGKIFSARILATKGCPYNCAFCTTPSFYQGILQSRSPESVVSEMQEINKRYNISHFRFNDDLFINGTKENTIWIEMFCDLLSKSSNKYTFRVLCRVDSFNKNNDHLLKLLVDNGLSHVFLGVESGSDDALKKYNKKTSSKKNIETINRMRQMGLELQIGFIMFNPYTSFMEIKRNISFLEEVNEGHRLYYLTKRLSIFPNTFMEKQVRKDGLLKYSSYKDSIFCYDFNDKRIKKLSDYMQHMYNRNSHLDNTILREKDKQKRVLIQRINIKNFNKIVEYAENRKNYINLFDAWTNELKMLLDY